MKNIFIPLFLFLTATSCFSQTKNLTKDERKYYKTIESLLDHYKNKKYDTTQRNFIFKNFVYFDYVLADTSKAKIKERTAYFDFFFPKIFRYLDSVGVKNLDLLPTRSFKDNIAFFKHFDKDGELNDVLPLTLTYYDKRNLKKEPLGVLFFEQKTHKLAAWTMINQGGYWYFLTFNLF